MELAVGRANRCMALARHLAEFGCRRKIISALIACQSAPYRCDGALRNTIDTHGMFITAPDSRCPGHLSAFVSRTLGVGYNPTGQFLTFAMQYLCVFFVPEKAKGREQSSAFYRFHRPQSQATFTTRLQRSLWGSQAHQRSWW